MHKLLILLLAFVLAHDVRADTSCARPTETQLFLASGATTDLDGASHALIALRTSLGDSSQGRTMVYSLAYGQPDGLAQDLIQAADRAGATWDSRVMGWVAGIAGAPDWFSTWYAAFLGTASAAAPAAVPAQLAAYTRSIDFGRTVLVVAHGSANVDADAASAALTAQLGDSAAHGFGVFAVATPQASVGGAPGPYLTNDRDIVQAVPGALTPNWTLRHAGGGLATDVSRLDADRMETYVSADFDAQAQLLAGVQQKLAALEPPAPACGDFDYRKQFVSLVAGRYTGTCGAASSQPVTIGGDGTISLPSQSMDISEPHVLFALSRQYANAADSVADQRGVALRGISTASGGVTTGVDWDGALAFQHASVALNSCDVAQDTPPTAIAASVDIAAKATALMRDLRGSFAKGQCAALDATTGSVVSLPREAVWVDGSSVNIGKDSFDLTAMRLSEKVIVDSVDNTDGEPQFAYQSELIDGTTIGFRFKLNTGMTEFSSVNAKGVTLNCVRN